MEPCNKSCCNPPSMTSGVLPDSATLISYEEQHRKYGLETATEQHHNELQFLRYGHSETYQPAPIDSMDDPAGLGFMVLVLCSHGDS